MLYFGGVGAGKEYNSLPCLSPLTECCSPESRPNAEESSKQGLLLFTKHRASCSASWEVSHPCLPLPHLTHPKLAPALHWAAGASNQQECTWLFRNGGKSTNMSPTAWCPTCAGGHSERVLYSRGQTSLYPRSFCPCPSRQAATSSFGATSRLSHVTAFK